MADRENYIESCLDPRKRNMDRNRGLQAKSFNEALVRAAAAQETSDDAEKPDHSENLGK